MDVEAEELPHLYVDLSMSLIQQHTYIPGATKAPASLFFEVVGGG